MFKEFQSRPSARLIQYNNISTVCCTFCWTCFLFSCFYRNMAGTTPSSCTRNSRQSALRCMNNTAEKLDVWWAYCKFTENYIMNLDEFVYVYRLLYIQVFKLVKLFHLSWFWDFRCNFIFNRFLPYLSHHFQCISFVSMSLKFVVRQTSQGISLFCFERLYVRMCQACGELGKYHYWNWNKYLTLSMQAG